MSRPSTFRATRAAAAAVLGVALLVLAWAVRTRDDRAAPPANPPGPPEARRGAVAVGEAPAPAPARPSPPPFAGEPGAALFSAGPAVSAAPAVPAAPSASAAVAALAPSSAHRQAGALDAGRPPARVPAPATMTARPATVDAGARGPDARPANSAAGKDGPDSGAMGAFANQRAAARVARSRWHSSLERPALRRVDRLVLNGGGVVKGKVVDANGDAPVANALVEARCEGEVVEAVADGGGRFQIDGLPRGKMVEIWAESAADVFVPELVEVVARSDNQVIDVGVIRLLARSGRRSTAGGVGLYVARRGGALVVTAVAPWLPAEQAGFEVGDVLLAVDGKDVTRLGPRAALYLLWGSVGSDVELRVQRPGQAPRTIKTKRVLQ